MLDTARVEAQLTEAKAFAARMGKTTDLERWLSYLDRYACGDGDNTNTRCELHPDFAPYSFGFTMHRRVVKDGIEVYVPWFVGGIIYHGAVDDFGSGKGPTFAVTVEPTDGWSIHT